MLVLNARKFAALNTLGSTFFIISFGFLWGPAAYAQVTTKGLYEYFWIYILWDRFNSSNEKLCEQHVLKPFSEQLFAEFRKSIYILNTILLIISIFQFLFSAQRRYVTICYLSTVVLTLYTSVWVSLPFWMF
jgi:hypothetical protein